MKVSVSYFQIHYNQQSHFKFLVGWSLVAEKQECSGSEVYKGEVQTIEECGSICKGIASMFIFGTNDFGNNQCFSDGCRCYCETGATDQGTCEIMNNHDGFRLYKYTLGDYYALSN